jgi:hypothetical protein
LVTFLVHRFRADVVDNQKAALRVWVEIDVLAERAGETAKKRRYAVKPAAVYTRVRSRGA